MGQGSPDHALTLAYMPLGVLIAFVLAGLFAAAFRLGFAPPLISLGLVLALVGGVALATDQLRASAAAGTRLTLAHMGLVCLLGGVAAAPPADFPPLMLWSLTAMSAAAVAILFVEAWIAEKIDAAGSFSRRLGREAYGLLILSLTLLLWRSGKVGSWVVAAGLVHYAVLLLALVLPALRREPTAAWRRYNRAALAATLTAALVPAGPAGGAIGLAAIAILLAVGGAIADLRLLLRR